MSNIWFNKRTINFWATAAYKWWDFKDWIAENIGSPFRSVHSELYNEIDRPPMVVHWRFFRKNGVSQMEKYVKRMR